MPKPGAFVKADGGLIEEGRYKQDAELLNLRMILTG
jgi:hypothetical protein